MATTTKRAARPKTPATLLSLRVVISELQFINELVGADAKDPRLSGLFQNALSDLAKVAQKTIGGGSDPIIDKLLEP